MELGWMLRPEYRGNGYATEAGRAALDFAFSKVKALRAISLIRLDNSASERVARRLGGRQATTIDFLGGTTLVYVYHPPETDA
jgi:RimJ/RimL family protein N-acetyltransferase